MVRFSTRQRPNGRQKISAARRGITLIEMLIAIAISLIVMLAVIRVFDQLNNAMTASKSTIEQAGELRNLAQRLQSDFDGLTVVTLPWTPVDAGDGYLEIIERPQRDAAPTWNGTPGNLASATNINSYWGDHDDIIAFTSRSKDKPFVGRFNGNLIESELAEIIWWVDNLGDTNGNGQVDPQEVVIRRRALLIRPDLSPMPANVATFLQNNDVSVRSDGAGGLVANSLADLTLRQNRVAHVPLGTAAAFPNPFDPNRLPRIPDGHADEGIDIVLDKVVAFDVRVYDPAAPIRQGTGVALIPGDVGYANQTIIGEGAYVDLGYTVSDWSTPIDYTDGTTRPAKLGNQSLSFYSGRPSWRSQLDQLPFATYSTWPEAYEQDGINQDNNFDTNSNPLIDEGRDGFHTPVDRVDNSTGYPPADGTPDNTPAAADDPSEYETFPPYPHAVSGQRFPGLRGVQVRIRIVEPPSRQVRQATVVGEFLPE